MIAAFLSDDSGQDLIEYALLAVCVSLAAVLGAQALGVQLDAWYAHLTTRVDAFESAP